MSIGIINLFDQPFRVRVTERMRPRMTRRYDRRYGVQVFHEFGTITYADNSLTQEEAVELANNVLDQLKNATREDEG